MKRHMSTLIAAAMLITMFAGCGSQTGEPPVSEGTPSAAAGEVPASTEPLAGAAGDTSEKLTISVNVKDSDKVGKDARYDYIQEKFNIDFDFISCGQDIRERVRVWVAGDDMPEIMWVNLKINERNELASWVEAGVLREFPDMSPYPNMAAARAQQKGADVLQVDGKDYVWTAPRGLAEYDNISAQGFYYRRDWAEALGMAKEEYTWEEMKELAKAFIEKDPGGNGEGKTIGLAGVSWGFPHSLGIVQHNAYWNTFYKRDGKYVFGGFDESAVQGVKELKELYDSGILWEDQPLAKGNDAPNQFMAGQAGILFENFHPNSVQNMKQQLKKADPEVNADLAVYPMKLRSPDGSFWGFQAEDFYGAFTISSKIEDKKMNRFLTMSDWLLSEEGQRFHSIGIEGEDYVMEDGKEKILWETDENGDYINPYVQYSDALFAQVRLNENSGYTSPLCPPGTQKAVNMMMEWLSGPDASIQAYDYDLAVFDGPTFIKYNIVGEMNDKVVQLLISSNDIEKDYRDFVASMEPKVTKILEEINASLAD